MAEEEAPHDGDGVVVPVLVVDWTRVAQRLLPSHEDGTHVEANDVEGLWSALKHRFETHDAMCEALFEAEAAVHSTAREAQDVVHRMKRVHGRADHLIRQESYPSLDTGHAVEEVWVMLEKDSTWQAVNALRDLICDCNRPVSWKLHMTMEVENLALKQEMLNTAERLAALAGNGGKNQARHHNTQQPDTEPEPFDPFNPHMNILDRIIVMCLSRMPPPLEREAHAQHTQTLMQLHMGVRAMWLDEFGALPASVLWGAGVGGGGDKVAPQQRHQHSQYHDDDGDAGGVDGDGGNSDGLGSSAPLGSDLSSFSMAARLGLLGEGGAPGAQGPMPGLLGAGSGVFGLQPDVLGDDDLREEDEQYAGVFRFKPMMAFLDGVEDGAAQTTGVGGLPPRQSHHSNSHGDDCDDWLPFRDELDDDDEDADDPLADAFADVGDNGSSAGSSEPGSEYEADDEGGDDEDDVEDDEEDGGVLDAFFQASAPNGTEPGVDEEERVQEEQQQEDVMEIPLADDVQSSDHGDDPHTQHAQVRQPKRKVLLS